MASSIDSTKPVDGLPAVKADLRDNLQAAKDEIEALQAAEVPAGGATGQVLRKASGIDHDMAWTPGADLPTGGTSGQVLQKATGADFDAAWTSAALPTGGTTGQRLTKLSGADFAVGWQTPSATATSTPVGFVTPDDYGAVGDDATDNTTAFDTMFAALSGGGADEAKGLWLPPGNVYLSKGNHTITGRDDLIIVGNGSRFRRHPATVMSNNFGFIEFHQCNRLRVHDLGIDGNRDNVAPVDEFGHALKLRGPMADYWFVNCIVEEAQGDCLDIKAKAGVAEPDDPANHTYDGVFMGCVFRRAHRNNVSADYGHRLRFVGCAFVEATGTLPSAGFDAEPISDSVAVPTPGVDHLSFESCLFKDNDGAGLMLASSGSSNNWITSDIAVTGCHFINNGAGNVGTPLRAAMRLQARRVMVQGCSFRDHTVAPDGGTSDFKPLISVHVGPEYKTAKHCTFTGNTFFNNPGATQIIATRRNLDAFTGDERRLWIEFSHNLVDASAGLATGTSGGGGEDDTAAIVSWQYSELRAIGNTFIGDGNIEGVRLVRTSGSTELTADCIIDDNRFENFAVGIRNDGAQHSIRDNIFTNVTTPQTGSGSAART